MFTRDNSKRPVKGKSFLSPKGKTVYIGNLSYKINEKDIFGIFGKFGRVKYVKVVKTPNKERSKGIAFVDMIREGDAHKAIKALDGRIIEGRKVKVSIANDQKSPALSANQVTEKKRGFNKEEIIQKKKDRRSRGLAELRAMKNQTRTYKCSKI